MITKEDQARVVAVYVDKTTTRRKQLRNPPPLMPTWDAKTHQLCFAGVLVKELQRRAFAQRLILDSFQELGWQEEIDDPLPPEHGHNSKKRLHDTIAKLNRHHLNC